jgi:hypothetical protein
VTTLSTDILDAILTLQLTVAWAGEGRCEPRRLGWWQTDLVDPAGGGDLFARLTPRTAPWAALEAVREAARRVDALARRQMSDPDAIRTLYFLGFDMDEPLDDRLAHHKRAGVLPAAALSFAVDMTAPFSAELLEAALRDATTTYAVVPGGRQLKGAMPTAHELMVKHLAAALLPFSERYPMPFYRVTR